MEELPLNCKNEKKEEMRAHKFASCWDEAGEECAGSGAGGIWWAGRWNLTNNSPIQLSVILCNMYCKKCHSSKDQLMGFLCWHWFFLLLDLKEQ